MASRILNNEHLEAFAKWLNLEEKSSATCEKYIRDIYRFMEYAADESVSKEVVARWKNDLIARGYAVRSINSIQHFLQICGSHLAAGFQICAAEVDQNGHLIPATSKDFGVFLPGTLGDGGIQNTGVAAAVPSGGHGAAA